MSAPSRLAAALDGRYTIERELGQGGMATVYLAHDVRHDRKVALKVLRPELSAILGGARFLAEIKTTANLQHPHILGLFDSGEADGTVFYVMPYVVGESLRDRLSREKQLPVDDAVRIAKEVADALHYAHGQGIVHRDIKPENILLHGGHAMVADFGIALAASRSDGGTRMTETGMSLGTPHYMSPEQAMGEKEITAKADIYALGCVLYEMLTAEPPFTGATAQAIIARVMTEEPRSLTLQRRTIPPHVEAVVRQALEKLPADRFASAAEFAAALSDPSFTGAGAAVRGPGRATGRQVPALRRAVVAAVTAAIALAAGFLAGRRSAPLPPPRLMQFTIDAPDSVVVVNRCCGRAIALSPDGATLVFIGFRGQGGPLFRRTVGQLEAQEIPGTMGASLPFFSPDGRWLGFFSEGRLRKVALAGGPTIPILTSEGVSGASWTEADSIVFAEQGRIRIVAAGGGAARTVPTADSVTRFQYPFALPGGRAALVSIRTSGGSSESWRIGVMDLASGAVDTLGFGTRAEYASGHLLVAGSDHTLMAQPFDPRRRATAGEAIAIFEGLRFSGSSNHEFAVASSGALAFLRWRGARLGEQLRVAGSSGRTTVALPGQGDVNLEDPAISPDGRQIVVRLTSSGNAGSPSPDLWLLDRQQSTLQRFTVSGGGFPVFSRDGRWLAYAQPDSAASGPAGIYVRPVDQSSAARLVLSGRSLAPGSWLPDGRTIVFSRGAVGTNIDIGSIALGDTAPRMFLATEFRDYQPQVSRDARWIAFVSQRSGRAEVFVQPLGREGGAVQVSNEGGSAPRWSPDGRTLYYADGATIVAASLTLGSAPRVVSRRVVVDGGVTDLNVLNVNWDLFPGGREFLYIDLMAGGTSAPVWVFDWLELVRGMRTGQR